MTTDLYAATSAAVWADLLRRIDRVLFYSADAANRSSQGFAERPRLCPIGWTRRLRAPAPEPQLVHP